MKKLIALLLLFTPSFAFAQTIPLPNWPDIIYCTNLDTSGIYAFRQMGMPDPLSSEAPFQYWYANNFPGLAILSFDGQGVGTSSGGGGLGTTHDCYASIAELLTQGKAFYFVRSNTPKMLPDEVAVRKSSDESIASNTTLQNDDQLSVAVKSGKAYVVEGTLFASATNAIPDIKIAFSAPGGSDIAIGYTSNAGAGISGELELSGAASDRIPLPGNTKVPVRIDGTIVAGADGTLNLQWAQFTSSGATLKVGKGSYLKVSEIAN